jgi:chloramphenicol 3-O-phosphotransferase
MLDPEEQDASVQPRIILLTGAPGSGKSTLGRALSAALRIPFIARDDVRGGLTMTAGAWRDSLDQLPASDTAVDAFLDIVDVSTAGSYVGPLRDLFARRARRAHGR